MDGALDGAADGAAAGADDAETASLPPDFFAPATPDSGSESSRDAESAGAEATSSPPDSPALDDPFTLAAPTSGSEAVSHGERAGAGSASALADPASESLASEPLTCVLLASEPPASESESIHQDPIAAAGALPSPAGRDGTAALKSGSDPICQDGPVCVEAVTPLFRYELASQDGSAGIKTVSPPPERPAPGDVSVFATVSAPVFASAAPGLKPAPAPAPGSGSDPSSRDVNSGAETVSPSPSP